MKMGQMAREYRSVAIVLAIASLVFVPLLACSYDFAIGPSGTPAVTMVTMARQLDNKQKPVDPTKVFQPADTFFCSVEVEHLVRDSQVTARWFYGEKLLDQFTLTTESGGSGYLGFNLSPETGTWPGGDYRVEIELNQTHAQTANFSVQASSAAPPAQAPESQDEASVEPEYAATVEPTATAILIIPPATNTSTASPSQPATETTTRPVLPTLDRTQKSETPTVQPGVGFMGIAPTGTDAPPELPIEPEGTVPAILATGTMREVTTPTAQTISPISRITLARGLDGSQRPVEPTNVFGQTDTFFCSVEVANLPAGSQITANWYRGEQTLDRFTLTTDTAGSGHLGFNLSAEEGSWPVGAYRVEIALDNVPMQIADFFVSPPDGAIPSRIKSAIMTRSVDDSYRATDPGIVFAPADSVHCSVNADLGLGSQLTAKWYQDGELLDEYITTVTADENMLDTFVDFYLAPSIALDPGPYSLEIFLDGQLSRAMDFTIGEVPTVAGPETPRLPSVASTPMMQAPAPEIGPISFSPQVTADRQPIAPGTTFPEGTTTIYATFDYQGFDRGISFEQIWYLNDQETARGSFLWNEVANGRYEGSLNNEQSLLPGSYRLEVFLDGKALGSGKFVVGEAPSAGDSQPPAAVSTIPVVPKTVAPPAQVPSIGPINFSAEGLTGLQPITPRASFPQGTKTVYATFTYSDFRKGDIFEQLWYLNGQESGRGSFAWSDAETGQYQGSLSNGNGLMPGNYRLEINLNGRLLGSGQFAVESARVPEVTPTAPVQAPPTAKFTREPTATQAGPLERGFKIVYTATEGDVHSLWTINLDGTNRALVTDHASDPTWSPDGSTIAFYGWDGHPRGGGGIYQISTDGTSTREIWNQGSAEYLDWSHAGRYIAMNAFVSGTSNKRLVVYDVDGNQWRDIGPGEQPSFSPDGSTIVARTCVGSNCGLFIMGQFGENKRRVTASADDAMPSWSPLGDRIVYSSQRDGNWDIWTISVDGSEQQRLTQDLGIDAMPVWLPDGSGIVYRSTRDGAWGVWIMNADGSNPRKVVDAPAAADWGRDRLDVR